MNRRSKIVFTNGCFDILHPGHVRLLRFCKSLGTVIVGLNSDKSVKNIKGPNRPINSENDRKYMLKSLRWVDDVIVFDENTPIDLIQQIKPDFIIKGGDYREPDVCSIPGAKVIIYEYQRGYSTTKIIESISNR
jgi:D-beta-D-heptose 7-phosphate kinase/D-beta-D-heptose 1-phosphate adenosyltransferase